MTEEIGWASLGIVPTLDRGFDSKLSRDLNPGLSRVGRDSGKMFGGILGKAAVAGAAGIIGAGFAAFRIGQDALGEAREAQEIGRTSAAILKATKGAANLTRKEYDKLTESLMRKTAIDDEQIAQAGNLLLTFKNVKREGKGVADIFGRTLSSALDLSAAGFGSSDSAAKMLGKALNDPVAGITALSRAGVTFSQDQKDAIAKMVETNNLLGAQKLILREVESQVGGTAAKQKTSAKELETAWGNVKEELGFALIPVMDDLADVMLDKGIPAAREFSAWVKDDGIPQVKGFVEEIKPLAEDALPAVADVLGEVRDFGKAALPYIEDMVEAFNDMPDWMQKVLIGGAAGGLVAKKTGLLGLLTGGKGGSGLLSKATPLPVFVVNNGIGGTGGTGATGKPKGGPVGALAKGTLGRVGGLASLNFLLSGDSAPVERSDTGKAYIRLIELVEKDLGRALEKGEWFDVLYGASVEQVRTWRRTLLDEFGVGFGQLAKLPLETGGFAVPQGLTAKDQIAKDQNLRDAFAEGTKFEGLLKKIPNNVETKFFTPGLTDSRKDVDKLIERFDLDLDKREVKTLYTLLGVDDAIGKVTTLTDRLSNIPGALENLHASDGAPKAGPNVVIQNAVINDGRDLLRHADRERSRSNSDNVRRRSP